MEQSFVMVKPDGVQRGLVGDIVSRFERKGYKISALRMLQITREKAETHYFEHKGKSFYEPLIEFITSGPVVAMILEGEDVIAGVRRMLGATKPSECMAGTIRGDFGITLNRNIVHASDSLASAAREISIFFNSDDILNYDKVLEKWIYSEK